MRQRRQRMLICKNGGATQMILTGPLTSDEIRYWTTQYDEVHVTGVKPSGRPYGCQIKRRPKLQLPAEISIGSLMGISSQPAPVMEPEF
jgi:hypothetical protein